MKLIAELLSQLFAILLKLSKPKIAETLTLKPDHFSEGRPIGVTVEIAPTT
jgi:hypothetical protein